MKDALRTGFAFGLTSGVITTLGLMVGLHSGTHSRLAVLGGILTIAVADAFSDALGIHVSEEAENVHSSAQIWVSTVATFLSKFGFASSFAVPVLFLELDHAIFVSLLWGFSLLIVLSYLLARAQSERAWKVIFEHVFIALVVIGITHWVGDRIAHFLNE